jgi:hypothetical protein
MTEQSPPEDPLDPRITELERRLADQETTLKNRLAQAELKSHALRAGILDLDGLKLLDPGSIKLGANGEIENAEALMTELRRAKPWLFQTVSSSSAAAVPPTTPPTAKRATAMSHTEWQAARAEMIKRR